MQSKHVIGSVILGAALVSARAGAMDRRDPSRWEYQFEGKAREHYGARGPMAGRSIRAAPEFGAGAVGSAAAVVVGGLMVLSGYRKKRQL